MDKIKKEIVCHQVILCKTQKCDKIHPRCFAGICLANCGKDDCPLHHFKEKEYKTEIKLSPINGIYRFNICKKANCQNPQNCQFLHPPWAKGYCIPFLMDECEEQHNNHISWQELQKQVYKQYAEKLRMKCNPEQDLEKQENYFKSNNVCINYFKGICEKRIGECKQHIFWEDISKLEFITKKVIRSCIIENQDQCENLNKYQSQSIFCDEKNLKKLQMAIKEQNIIDVIFIMDITGSMQKWIDACKAHIKGIIEKFTNTIQSCSLRMGFVGYRDVTDKEKLVYNEITSDIETLVAMLAKQNAGGGGDAAEDVCSGIEKAMSLNISKHPDSILITILFADAPCHGKQYHNGVGDDLADQVKLGTLENLMKRYYKLKTNNFFTCVNITPLTQKMFQIMQENFEGLFISEPQISDNFQNLVYLTLHQSLIETQTKKQLNQFEASFEKARYMDYLCESKEQKNNFWENFDTIHQTRKGQTKLQLDSKEMNLSVQEKGRTCSVFRFYDLVNNLIVVIKVKNELLKQNQSNIESTESEILNYQKENRARFFCQSKARQLAQIFRQKTKHIKGAPPIFFPIPILYTLTSKKFQGLNQLYGEAYIDISGETWQKYSNNGIFCDQEKYYYQSFSHFVFDETQRWFTFTDLQGKRNILSDPAIQTVENYDKISSDQDKSNFQNTGIGQFLFTQHKNCSFICKELKLFDFVKSNQINKIQWQPQRNDGNIDVICEECETQFLITQDEYQQNINICCMDCKERLLYSSQNFCQCCRDIFTLQFNQGVRVLSSVTKCNECKITCRMEKSAKCEYCKMKCQSNLKEVQIKEEQKKITICTKGQRYLETLECQKCGAKYNFQAYITKDDYEKGVFICKGCK